jgi:hypothetical protein
MNWYTQNGKESMRKKMNKIILFAAIVFMASTAFCQTSDTKHGHRKHSRQRGGVDLRQQKQIDAYYKSVLPGYVGGPTFAVPGYGGRYTGDMRPTRVGPAVTINRYPRRRVYSRPQVYNNPYQFGTPGYFVPFR